jgi:hypothetical protein
LTETRRESETTSFSSRGTVKTGDGTSLDFSLDLLMDREFFSSSSVTVEESGRIRLLDPLVVNLAGEIPHLSEACFSFDLDVDGVDETIPRLVRGSGFLALDANLDGVVNDGSELFGALTDNGFAELARHDEDRNGWIDENDPVFDRLSVWSTDPDTGDSLASLAESGVGAIFLDSRRTRFDLTGDDGEPRARIERTGIFLDENGGAGSVQELKFVV